MTRYIVIGAGAVGASLAAQFELSGIDYALIGRGEHIRHVIDHGLTYRRPSGVRQIRLKAFDAADPPPLAEGDILLLTVKSQDAADALASWAWRPVGGSQTRTASHLPLVTFQNGLATEAAALRTFSHVYGASILTPARFTETGKIAVGGDPQVGVVTLGRYPHGSDATAELIVADLNRADYIAETSDDVRRWKATKLTYNVRNVLDLVDGPEEARTAFSAKLVAEASAILEQSGYSLADRSERKISLANWRTAENSGISAGQQSTWQSFVRGASSEVDYLNGEIVLLGRLLGIATPYNEAAQRAAALAAQVSGLPAPIPVERLQSLVDDLLSHGS